MNRNHGSLNVALLPGLVLAAIAAGGSYYYYTELEQQQNTIDQLTQT